MTENQCNKCLAAISKPTSCSSSDAPPVAVVYYACDKCSLAALGGATRAKLEKTVGGKYSVCYVHASKCEFPALSLSKLLCFVLQVKPSVMSTTVKYFAHMRRRPLSPRRTLVTVQEAARPRQQSKVQSHCCRSCCRPCRRQRVVLSLLIASNRSLVDP